MIKKQWKTEKSWNKLYIPNHISITTLQQKNKTVKILDAVPMQNLPFIDLPMV